ncbi:MAG: helix-turn-helix domain-containing protein [Spirochaetia bacterium]|jgi:predicted site-specific integrase-resolvase|nr:helix-turn-helix domain-containing protein [Spirochaetia bacterium]
MPQTLLTRRQAASILGVAEITCKRYTLTGLLPSVKISSRVVRIDPTALDAFISRRSTADPLDTSGAVAVQAEAL